MNLHKVLILEPERISQELLKTYFLDGEIKVTGSSIEAFKILKDFRPNLILINSSLGGLNGYDTCELITQSPENKNIPVIFLTDNPSTEEKKRAYGLGAFNYISKPYDIKEFKNKVDLALSTNSHLITSENNLKNITSELNSSYSSVLDMQNKMALMQYINDFLKSSLFCHDYKTLIKLIVSTINKFGSSCVIYIENNSNPIIESENNIVHEIEYEIIKVPVTEKVTMFGNNRAIFSWPSVRVLVRNIYDNSDYITFLMDSIEATINTIKTESELLTSVDELQEQNYKSQEEASTLFSAMNNSLKEIFL